MLFRQYAFNTTMIILSVLFRWLSFCIIAQHQLLCHGQQQGRSALPWHSRVSLTGDNDTGAQSCSSLRAQGEQVPGSYAVAGFAHEDLMDTTNKNFKKVHSARIILWALG